MYYKSRGTFPAFVLHNTKWKELLGMIKDKPVPIPRELIENPDNIDPYIIYRKARELGIFYPDLLEAQLKYLYPTKIK